MDTAQKLSEGGSWITTSNKYYLGFFDTDNNEIYDACEAGSVLDSHDIDDCGRVWLKCATKGELLTVRVGAGSSIEIRPLNDIEKDRMVFYEKKLARAEKLAMPRLICEHFDRYSN